MTQIVSRRRLQRIVLGVQDWGNDVAVTDVRVTKVGGDTRLRQRMEGSELRESTTATTVVEPAENEKTEFESEAFEGSIERTAEAIIAEYETLEERRIIGGPKAYRTKPDLAAAYGRDRERYFAARVAADQFVDGLPFALLAEEGVAWPQDVSRNELEKAIRSWFLSGVGRIARPDPPVMVAERIAHTTVDALADMCRKGLREATYGMIRAFFADLRALQGRLLGEMKFQHAEAEEYAYFRPIAVVRGGQKWEWDSESGIRRSTLSVDLFVDEHTHHICGPKRSQLPPKGARYPVDYVQRVVDLIPDFLRDELEFGFGPLADAKVTRKAIRRDAVTQTWAREYPEEPYIRVRGTDLMLGYLGRVPELQPSY